MGWMARKEDSPQWLKDFRASRGIPEPVLGPEESTLPEPNPDRNVVHMGAPDGRFTPLESQRQSIPERLISKLPNSSVRDIARVATHGLARTGNTILRAIDIPNRIFGNTRSVLQDIYESSEQSLSRDAYEDPYSAVPQVGETTVHLATAGVLGKALPAVFGANVGADTYETAKYAGASEGEALAKGVGHGVVDTAIWTLGQGLASKYLPKAWQWLGRELTGAMRGAASSVTSDAVLNSLGADISGEEMAKRAVHAAWMVPLLGMLKMGKGSRERALAELKKVRPDLAGERVDKVIETLENEFSDPRSQKVALAWVARKGANLPDDLAQIHQALEVANKVKGIDFTQKSPFEIISDPAYARYLPKPKPQDVKAFSNMKRYPMGVIGFDVSDDAAGRQATREMINAYMSPSSNPWCLATGSGAAKLGELGPGAEGYWEQHSAVPKQIFFQEVDGKLELTAFRATSPGGEGTQEYWDTSDAGYSGIPLKVKVPGDPMGRYQKMVFRPDDKNTVTYRESESGRMRALTLRDARQVAQGNSPYRDYMSPADVDSVISEVRRRDAAPENEVQGTFEDIAPGKIFKGDPFRDGRSQTWVKTDQSSLSTAEQQLDEYIRLQNENPADPMWRSEADAMRETIDKIRQSQQYVLVEDKARTTENGITKFRTTKYADPTNQDYEPPKPGEQPKPVEIEESELVSPEWMRSRGYDPENESDTRRMQKELGIQAWGNGVEAAMAVVPTRRTYMQTKSGTPETVTYGPNGRDVVSVDFEKDGVPYREEYFHSGARGAYVPGLLGDREALGIAELPGPSRDYIGINEPNGFRLTRNPGGESPEVLDEIKWDDGLGGFVRTSGNKRWRLGTSDRPEDLSFWDTGNGRGKLYQEYLDGRVTQDEVRHELNWSIDELDSEFADTRGLDHDLNLLETVPRDRIRGVASIEGWGIITEERQSDGTWTNARSTVIPESAQRRLSAKRARMTEGTPDDPPDEGFGGPMGQQNQLPPPPPVIPAFAAKAGRTRRDVRVAAKGGDAGTRADEEGGGSGPETAVSETAVSNAPAPQQSGPRIVINPTVFEDDKDALCVAFNEAFRIVMEDMAFDPVSEPTERQRKFFSDTAYADDETQLRRTILARICTFDTSVKDPTDEQLQEAVEFLESVMEAGYPQDEREQAMVQRIHDVVAQSVGRPQTKEPEETSEPSANEPTPVEEPEAVQGDIGGGESRYAYTKNGIDYDINDNPLTKAESNPDYAYTKDGIDYDINGNPLNAAQTPGPTTPQNQAEAAAPKEPDEPKEEATLDQMLEQAQTGELFGENPMSSVDDAPDRVWNELADVQSVEMEEGPTVTLTAGGAQTSGGFGGPLTLSARPRGRGFADVGGPLTTRVSFDGRIENSGTERSRRAALRGFV